MGGGASVMERELEREREWEEERHKERERDLPGGEGRGSCAVETWPGPALAGAPSVGARTPVDLAPSVP